MFLRRLRVNKATHFNGAGLALGLVFSGLSQPAYAQSNGDAAKQTSWNVNCASNPQVDKLLCLMAQEIKLRETGQRVVRMQINLAGKTQQPFMSITLPHGILFSEGVQLQVDERKSETFPINSADQNGSYVAQSLTARLVDEMRRGNAISLTMTTLNKQKLKVGISLVGFDKALKMLVGASKL